MTLTLCSACGASIEQDQAGSQCRACGQALPQSDAMCGPVPEPTAEEVCAFVGTNAGYYLERWRCALEGTGRPRGFHWPAFLFADLWLPYRKLWKASLVRYVAIFGITAVVTGWLEVAGGPEFPGWNPATGIVAGVLAAAVAATGFIAGCRANHLYWDRARTAIAAVRRLSLREDEHYRLLSRQGGTSVLGLGGSPALGLAGLLATVCLIQTVPLIQQAAIERDLRQELEAELPSKGIKVHELRLSRRPDGNFEGTINDVLGQDWDLLRVWKDGGQFRWYVRESLPRSQNRFAAEIAQAMGEPVRFCRIDKRADGTCAGRAETQSGIVCKILETRPGPAFNPPPLLYWTLAEETFPAWLKLSARKQNLMLSEIRLEPKGDGEWRGPASDAFGNRFEAILRTHHIHIPGTPPGTKLGVQLQWELVPRFE